jgi:class 3 adenylate cyclase
VEAARLKERKLVTALFCDLVGSTALGESLDPELHQRIQAGYFERMEAVIAEFGGTVEKFLGDAVVAVFGVPKVHEDDSLRAVLCAFAMQEALRGLNDTLRPRLGLELSIRIGVATGEAIEAGHGALATGDVMNAAARLQQSAEPGEIVVGPDAAAMTERAIVYDEERPVEAKGKAEPIRARLALRRRPSEERPRADYVGREQELERLAAALETAIATGQPQIVAVLGEPGIGKSRLAAEFSARASGRATVLAGACTQYGSGTTWRPIAQIVSADAGLGEADDEAVQLAKLHGRLAQRHADEELPLVEAQLAGVIGVRRTSAAASSEILWALRRYVEALAQARPTVLVLDDLHWASPQLVEVIDELAATLAGAPLLLILQGRPEMREKLAATLADERTGTVRLDALSGAEMHRLASALGTEVDEHVVERAEGNPLFLEELTSMLGDLSGRSIPFSVRALVASRLDLLSEDAKWAAQAAAVVGAVFWDRAVSTLLGEPDWLGSALRMLRSRGLIAEDGASPFPGVRRFRFHHALIAEVAYESVAKSDRVVLHRSAAGWLGDRVEERRELVADVAHHLAEALRYESELSPLEEPDAELTEAAVRALLAAAEWALLNAGATDAVALAGRAVEAAEPIPELQAVARGRHAAALVRAGRLDEAVAVAAAVSESAVPEASAFAALALAEAARDQGRNDEIEVHAERAIARASEAGLPLVEAEALYIRFWGHFWAGDIAGAERAGLRAVELAAANGDLGLAARPLAFVGVSAMWRGEVEHGEQRTLEALRMAQQAASPSAIAAAHTAVGHVRRMQGRLEESIEHGRQRVALARQIGEQFHVASGLTLSVAEPLFDEGRLEEAWAALEEALAVATDLGSASLEGPVRVRRARILIAWNRYDEAEAELAAMQPGKGTGADDHAAARAELLAAQGRGAEAEALWREVLGRLPEGQILDRVELAIPFADYLVRSGSSEAAGLLSELRAQVDGTGAALLERRLTELEAQLVHSST